MPVSQALGVTPSPRLPALLRVKLVAGALPLKLYPVPLVPPLIVPVAVTVLNAPVFAVVAPTVPLMLMLAVPVRLVTVPLLGVPSAPPLTTNAPAEPVLTPRAVTTPVPVVVVLGAAPAPPPMTNALAASAVDDASVPVAVKARTPPDVPAVRPVPPDATGRAAPRVSAEK